MARMTKAERDAKQAELEALLADDDDDDDEVTITHGDNSFKGSMRRARGVAAAWGIKLQADPPADDDDDAKAKPASTRFAGRRIG